MIFAGYLRRFKVIANSLRPLGWAIVRSFCSGQSHLSTGNNSSTVSKAQCQGGPPVAVSLHEGADQKPPWVQPAV